MDFSSIVQVITCPITQDVMRDPVTGNDGYTYERTAITQALLIKSESPMTRTPMYITDLTVNPSIRFLCDKYHNGEITTNQTISQNHNYIPHPQLFLTNEIKKINSSNYLHINFSINESTLPNIPDFKHYSQDVCLIIDRSGSMNSRVESKDENGSTLEDGMSIQDIVNHAAKTVAKSLDNNSRLAIIAFDSSIETVIDLILMNDINKTNCISKIDSIRPRNQTNIWGAIQSAISIFNNRTDKSRNTAIIMLTDGQPNISPARGEIETLKNLRTKDFYTPIYSFGFGYALQRELLYDMAKYSGGANGHIPDGGMIATVFCNFISNIMCTVFVDLKLYINSNKVKILGDFANYYDSSSESFVYDIGCILVQQSRDIIFKFDKDLIKFTYYYTYRFGDKLLKSEIQAINIKNITSDNINSTITHINRYTLIDDIRKMINYNKIGQINNTNFTFNNLKTLLETNQYLNALSLGMYKNLIGDDKSSGQIDLAINNQTYFRKWGEFYLDQLSRSLNQQIKPNFKDPGCPFGGQIFNDLVDNASDIFDTLPPPTPSLINNNINNQMYSYNNTGSFRSLAPPLTSAVFSSRYNNVDGGCFTKFSNVLMADNTLKQINLIKPGDKVYTLTNPYNVTDGNIDTAEVICLIKINSSNGYNSICSVNGLHLSAWHPIYYNNDWVFPSQYSNIRNIPCPYLYNLVLSNGHIININNNWAITFGHNYNVGILNHSYFGSQNIVNDLKKSSTWHTGFVEITNSQFKRNQSNNQICGITI